MRRIAVVLSIVCFAGLLLWLNGTDRERSTERGAALEREVERGFTRDGSPARGDDIAQVESHGGAVPLEEIPRVYRGPVRLRGMVVEKDGSPVADTIVHVHVPGVLPFTDAQRRYLQTRTFRDGSFEFPALPSATHYQLAACRPLRRAFAQIHAPGADRIHRIELNSDLHYDRSALFDAVGNPIPVAGAWALPTPTRGSFDDTAWNGEPWESLAGLLPDPSGLASNEILSVYAPPPAFGAGPTNWKALLDASNLLWVPGFQPIAVRSRPRVLSQWPAADRVVLQRGPADDGRRTHVVTFPARLRPNEWRRFGDARWFPQLTLRVTEHVDKRLPQTWRVTPGRNRFRAAGAFELRSALAENEPFPYRTEQQDDAVHVIPEWPQYAYLTVRYSRLPDREAAACVESIFAARVDSKARHVRAVCPYPGLALLGPLPTGEWRLTRIVAPIKDAKPSSTGISLGRLEAGHRFVDWEN